MRTLILSIPLILVAFFASAQTDYLVTNKADTIKGNIKLLTYDKIDRVQILNNGKKEVYTALQLLLVNKDNVNYKPIQKDNTIRLMQVLKSGYLSLYGFNFPNQYMFDGRYLVKLDGSAMEMPNISFKKVMIKFLEECREVTEKIKNGELGKADIGTIIDEYNICGNQVKPSSPAITISEDLKLLQNLLSKVKELNFDTKEDALDILNDMQSKLEKKEKVSNYLIEGLGTALKDQTAIKDDLDQLTDLLKKN